MLVRYLQDANLPGFLIIAVFAGLELSLKVAEPVGEKLFIQLVVVSLLTRDHQLFLLTGYLMRFANKKQNARLSLSVLNALSFMNSHHAARALIKIIGATFYMGTQNKYPPLPPVSSDSYDFGPAHSEHGCHGVVLPVFPCVPSLSAPPFEPGELVTPLSRTQTETHADSKEQEEQRQKKKN